MEYFNNTKIILILKICTDKSIKLTSIFNLINEINVIQKYLLSKKFTVNTEFLFLRITHLAFSLVHESTSTECTTPYFDPEIKTVYYNKKYYNYFRTTIGIFDGVYILKCQ